MEILPLLLTIAPIYICQADIWLTINDEKLSHYVDNDARPQPIAILCHQRIALGNGLSSVTKKKAIQRSTTLKAYIRQDTFSTSKPWNVTYEMSITGDPTIYLERRRTALIGRQQSSQDYFASGYILIAPEPADSGLYRCRGEMISKGQQIIEESETVTLLVAYGPASPTVLITNDAYATVMEVQQGSPLTIRCQTLIFDTSYFVELHQVYKYQNLTRRSANGVVDYYRTDAEVCYNSLYMWTRDSSNNLISTNPDVIQYRTTFFDLTSTFTVNSPGISNTGMYNCIGVLKNERGDTSVIPSKFVFIDVRGSAIATLLVAPLGYTANDKVCKFGSDSVLVNRYTCDGLERDSLIAVCEYYSYDFIPIVQLTVAKRASKIYDQKDYESVDMARPIGQKPYHFIKLAGSVSTIFNASEICSIPEVTCSVSVPGGSPERTRIRTISLMSNFCQRNGNEIVKSPVNASGNTAQVADTVKSVGLVIDMVPSMFFVCWAIVNLTM